VLGAAQAAELIAAAWTLAAQPDLRRTVALTRPRR
jgi:hypothetical protein